MSVQWTHQSSIVRTENTSIVNCPYSERINRQLSEQWTHQSSIVRTVNAPIVNCPYSECTNRQLSVKWTHHLQLSVQWTHKSAIFRTVLASIVNCPYSERIIRQFFSIRQWINCQFSIKIVDFKVGQCKNENVVALILWKVNSLFGRFDFVKSLMKISTHGRQGSASHKLFPSRGVNTVHIWQHFPLFNKHVYSQMIYL